MSTRRLFRRRTAWDRIGDNLHIVVTVVALIAAVIGWGAIATNGTPPGDQVASIDADVPPSAPPEPPLAIIEEPPPTVALAEPPQVAPATKPDTPITPLSLQKGRPLPSEEIELPPPPAVETPPVTARPVPPPPPPRLRQKAPAPRKPALVKSRKIIAPVKSNPVRARPKPPPRRRERPAYNPWGLN